MVVPGQGTPDTSRPLTRAELAQWPHPDVPAVAGHLTDARLLTADEDGLRLTHDALLTCWPRLRAWIDDDRERLLQHRMLAGAARAWADHDEDPGALYRGTLLARAEELFPDHPVSCAHLTGPDHSASPDPPTDPARLTGPGRRKNPARPMAPLRPTGPDHSTSPAHLTGPGHSENPGHPTDPGRPTNPAHPTGPVLTTPERRFLNAALAARDAERRAAARIGRRHRVLTGALITVLAVAMSTAFVVRREYEAARTQRIHSAARRVADVADALRTTDPRTALLLGAAAWRIAGLPETRRALLGSLDQAETDTFTDPAPGDGPYRALADGTAWHTWDVPGHRATGSGRVPAGTVTAAGADGRLLAVTGADGRVRLWNTTIRRWTGPEPRAAARPSFTRDGRAVLTTEGDRVRLRRAGDGRVLFETTTTRPALTALGADGRRVAVCPAGGAPRLWDTATGRALPGAWQRDRLCDDTGFLALTDGRLAAGTDRGFRVWNTTTGTRLGDTDDKDTQDASFSPDGAFLATADTTELRVWRLTDPALPVFRHALGNQHLYGGLVWDDDGHTLRYLEGATVHTVDAGTAVTTAWGSSADGVRLSPDGRAYAVARRTGGHYTVTLRATSDGRLLRTLPPAAVPVSTDPALPVDPAGTLPLLAFSPDGTRFAYGVSAPGRRTAAQPLTVWDLPRGRPVTTLDLPGGSVLATALGTGTLYVARSTPTGDVRDEVWDLARGRRTLTVDGVGASHLAVRPDGRLLAGDGKAARLPSGPAAPRDLVQGDEVGALAFTADGSLLAAGDQSGRVTLWDRDLRHREGILRDVLTASEGVSALAFSPDGRTLAVAGDAGSLQLWGVATQQPLGGPLTTPGEEIDSLAFAADGTTVYASSAHVPLQRYTVDTARALARVCARAGGTGLTPSYNRSGSTTTTYTWQITMKPGQFAAPIQVVERRWTQGAYQGVYHSTGKPCLPSPGDINAKPHFYTWSPNERWGRWTSNIAVQDYGTYHVWS